MKIELKDVVKKYNNYQLQCSMVIEPGQVTGMIGRNGAGKSTTFKAILNLIHIDEGHIFYDGQELEELDKEKKERMGVVLSDSGFSGYLMVKDIIPVMAAMYKQFDKDVFTKKCQHFSIPLDKKISEFSTGMKAKLKLLIAMSHNAEILILDEPTAGLDVVAREELLNLLREYMEEDNHSILISSHISTDLEGLCDDIYMIEDGNIILHESTDALLDEYGVLKVTESQFDKLDKEYILKIKKDAFGYRCLTNQKRFYMENYPDIAIEKSNVDDIITLMNCNEEER